MELAELAHIWIIVCPLVFLGGLIDAVAGGGGLITLPAYLIAGLPAHLASGTNKCGNAFGTFLSTGRFLKRGDVHMPSALAGAAGALVGAWVGARLNLVMPEQMLYYIMLGVVPVMAVFCSRSPSAAKAGTARDRAITLARAVLMIFLKFIVNTSSLINSLPRPAPQSTKLFRYGEIHRNHDLGMDRCQVFLYLREGCIYPMGAGVQRMLQGDAVKGGPRSEQAGKQELICQLSIGEDLDVHIIGVFNGVGDVT